MQLLIGLNVIELQAGINVLKFICQFIYLFSSLNLMYHKAQHQKAFRSSNKFRVFLFGLIKTSYLALGQ
jgi:uncharacterized protein YhhL (DUF1145 family)